TTRCRTMSKFLRESSSLQVALPDGSACNRIGVPVEWHDTHRALPARLVVKIGCTRVLKNSKSSVGAGGACWSNKAAAIGSNVMMGITGFLLLASSGILRGV